MTTEPMFYPYNTYVMIVGGVCTYADHGDVELHRRIWDSAPQGTVCRAFYQGSLLAQWIKG